MSRVIQASVKDTCAGSRGPGADLDVLTDETLVASLEQALVLCIRKVCTAVWWPEEQNAHQECFPPVPC